MVGMNLYYMAGFSDILKGTQKYMVLLWIHFFVLFNWRKINIMLTCNVRLVDHCDIVLCGCVSCESYNVTFMSLSVNHYLVSFCCVAWTINAWCGELWVSCCMALVVFSATWSYKLTIGRIQGEELD